jgi:hypothetical protein
MLPWEKLDTRHELFASYTVGFGVPLDCRGVTSYRRRPSLFNRCQIRPMLSETPASLDELACS